VAEFADAKDSQPGTLDFMGLSGDIWQVLEKFDERVKQYHLSLQDPGLNHFKDAIRLLAEMIRGIVEPTSGWHPKFTAGSKVAWVVAISAVGSLRSLLTSYKLLISGYFMEAHASIRMVEQWAELSVIVEANPSLANKVLEEGVKKEYLKSAHKKSPDFDRLLKAMDKTFRKLSQRGHVTKTAIRFIAPSIGNEAMELVLAGVASNEMLRLDGLALAGMTMNVLRVLGRHFRTVPSQWHSRFALTDKLIEELKRVSPKPLPPPFDTLPPQAAP
jgi:hypothetical protein